MLKPITLSRLSLGLSCQRRVRGDLLVLQRRLKMAVSTPNPTISDYSSSLQTGVKDVMMHMSLQMPFLACLVTVYHCVRQETAVEKIGTHRIPIS